MVRSFRLILIALAPAAVLLAVMLTSAVPRLPAGTAFAAFQPAHRGEPAGVSGQSQPTTASQVTADIQQVEDKSYDITGVAITHNDEGRAFIGISGYAIPTADGYTQQVFFFLGTTYLGTDTSTPSPGAVVTGSPGAGKIDVRYDNYAPNDPLCCPSRPPVTITYSLDGSRVVPSGTPPGH